MSLLHTPLHQAHLNANGKLVDFSGWHLPIHYGSQVTEHSSVRQHCGVFDVSHMTVVDVDGEQATEFLRHLFANDVAKLHDQRALYSCMLNEQGGVIDDLIVYRRSDTAYRVVVNAATREQDLAWIQQQVAEFSVSVSEQQHLALIAVQGPAAREMAHRVLPEALSAALADVPRFGFAEQGQTFVARTGYTGEDGYEIALPAEQAEALWQALLEKGAAPCGLGARDTLRLEAGMALYGQDLDQQTTPFEAGLAWTVSLKDSHRQFIGRAALEAQKAQGVPHKTVGLIMHERGVLRHGMSVLDAEGNEVGQLTSGTFSPSLKKSIALARLRTDAAATLAVSVRGKPLPVEVVKPPFVPA